MMRMTITLNAPEFTAWVVVPSICALLIGLAIGWATRGDV